LTIFVGAIKKIMWSNQHADPHDCIGQYKCSVYKYQTILPYYDKTML